MMKDTIILKDVQSQLCSTAKFLLSAVQGDSGEENKLQNNLPAAAILSAPMRRVILK